MLRQTLGGTGKRASAATQGEIAMSPTKQSASNADIRQLIAIRAYQLWENRGRPNGYDQIDWHQAEQEIMSCLEEGAELAEFGPRSIERGRHANNI